MNVTPDPDAVCPVCDTKGQVSWIEMGEYLAYTRCEVCGHRGQSLGSGPESFHPHLYLQRLSREREIYRQKHAAAS